ncbi:uncharacterized protein LOC118412727 [Branchiostoma floridae]|uniref:Uncharacterized protein LOC118412727 n=1 Tax=Branchiostoma floridae TaxID=7739 RepID=A0A9J7MLX6_BRAFL|nr:uncharacterized protein LOC118412727 [Branchiostoma floridae]XP_035671659.1 uncharacterized protein LOC118412727 [Branchiostoma floridae]XP_035671668.1 uncharacterized protein LOC118412727 [Branchiostoma floridae]
MSIRNKVGTAAAIMAMALAFGNTEDAPAALNIALAACAAGEVPDGLGNCVACDTCTKYPDSPYCALCGTPGKGSKTPDQWKIGVGVGVPVLVLSMLAAVLLYKLWYRRRHDEEQHRDQENQGGLVQIPVPPAPVDDEVVQAPAGPAVTVEAEQESGQDRTEPTSIAIQVQEDAGSEDFATETAPSTGQQQPSDEQWPLISDDEDAATVPK